MPRLLTSRRRAWALSVATALVATAALFLLPPQAAPASSPVVEPVVEAVVEAAVAPAVALPPPLPPAQAVPAASLGGPSVDGTFALATRAVRAGAPSELFAQLRLTGRGGSHLPVSLVVVLDRSGSMSGEKIEAARASIVQLLGEMADDDRLAVVAYDDDAELVQPLAPARVLRRSLPERIGRLVARGGTDIPAGLTLGYEALEEAPEGTMRRLILVSDGRDGSSRTLDEVGALVTQSHVVSSSLGVGLDYDQEFMTAVADAGRGNYAFLEHGSMLPTFLRRELDEAAATVAGDVVVELALPAGVRLVAAHGAIAHTEGRAVRLEIGSLFEGERRKVTFEMEATDAMAGTTLPLTASLSYVSSDERTPYTSRGLVAAAVARTDEEVEAAQDDELYPDALATILDAHQELAMRAWRAGAVAEARAASAASTERYHRASRRHAGSAVIAARLHHIDDEVSAYEALDPFSASGREFDLGTTADRREAMAGF